jgi:hypothetical protein
LALTPNTNEAFLREVDEELRRDQLAGFWTRWGRAVIVAVVLGLAVFAGFLFWQHRQTVAAGEEGERLQAAFDKLAGGQPKAAQPALAEIAQSDRDGYRALALITQADILLQREDLKGAAAKFAGVAADASLPQAFRDLALVRQSSAEFDTAKPQVIIDRLRPVAVPGNAFFGSAGELLGMAYLRQGRRDLAGRLFGQVARAEDVPASIRQRAVQMAGLLGVDTPPVGPGANESSAR